MPFHARPNAEGGGGAQGRNRTTDTVIFSHVLYQLSYLGMRGRFVRKRAYRKAYRSLSSPSRSPGIASGSAGGPGTL